MTTELSLDVDGTEVLLQGQGDQVVLMLHGWPDTHALWDDTVLALRADHVCARLTLPGLSLIHISEPTRPCH
jgi:pimeloyl-ACP methyl ester carboxylesterase